MDTALRARSRRRESGSLEDEVAYLQEHLRLGLLSEDRLQLAAHAGSRAAAALRPKPIGPARRHRHWLNDLQSRFARDGDQAAAASIRRRLRRLRRREHPRARRGQWVVEFDSWGDEAVWRVVLATLDFARARHRRTHPHLCWRRVDRLRAALSEWVGCPCETHAHAIEAVRLPFGAPDWLPLSEAAYVARTRFFVHRPPWGRGYLLAATARAGRRAGGGDALRQAIREAIVPWALGLERAEMSTRP